MTKLLAIIVTIYLIGFCDGDLTLNSDFNDLNLNFNQIKQLIESFNNETLIKAVKFGSEHMDRLKTLENRIASKVKIEKGSISYAQLLDSYPGKDVKDINFIAETILKSSSYLMHSYCKQLGVPDKDCVKIISKFPLPGSSLRQNCMKSLRKTDYKAYRRLLPAHYKDGLHKIRGSRAGHDLPTPREIAKAFFLFGQDTLKKQNNVDEGVLDNRRNVALAQWSQFIEHDISKTAFQIMENGSPIECCDVDSSKIAPRYTHPACAPITIDESDMFYKPFRVTCLNYVRSTLAIDPQCKFGEAQQLNQATNKFDLSQVYGVTSEETRKLRVFHQGQLKISNNVESPLLPIDNENCMNNAFPDEAPCYISGDSRVNVNPYVTILYTIFVRSHNQIAQKLNYLNPHWNDEQLFSVSRKINTAIYQKIIYTDWSNVVFGSKYTSDVINKKIEDNDYVKNFKTTQVSNEFAAVGIKFYNTMLPGDLFEVQDDDELYLTDKFTNVIDASDDLTQKKRIFKLQDVLYKPRDLRKLKLFEQIENAALQQPAMALDSSYVDDLSYQMYRSKMYENQVFGADSLAFDIQRGRDHGLPSYIDYIKKCMNIKITKWEDLHSIINENDLSKLKSIYSAIEDVDVIVGALCETPPENATVGPIFSCFIGEQLLSSKLSHDEFYTRYSEKYEDKLEKTVENYSATRLICDTTKLNKVQKNIFLLPSEENPMINCSNYQDIPKLDLSYWIDY